jgi:hypothetical protein
MKGAFFPYSQPKHHKHERRTHYCYDAPKNTNCSSLLQVDAGEVRDILARLLTNS